MGRKGRETDDLLRQAEAERSDCREQRKLSEDDASTDCASCREADASAGFPQWKFVDIQAPVWGIRHRRTATPIWIVAKAWQDPLPPTALNGITYYYEPRPSNSITLRWHFSEQVRTALPRAIEKEKYLKAKLIAPLVMEQKLVITNHSDDWEAGSLTPDLASFAMRHFMGYVVCP